VEIVVQLLFTVFRLLLHEDCRTSIIQHDHLTNGELQKQKTKNTNLSSLLLCGCVKLVIAFDRCISLLCVTTFAQRLLDTFRSIFVYSAA
jgi:hypothetical protein